jgi:hypothetical protein
MLGGAREAARNRAADAKRLKIARPITPRTLIGQPDGSIDSQELDQVSPNIAFRALLLVRGVARLIVATGLLIGVLLPTVPGTPLM